MYHYDIHSAKEADMTCSDFIPVCRNLEPALFYQAPSQDRRTNTVEQERIFERISDPFLGNAADTLFFRDASIEASVHMISEQVLQTSPNAIANYRLSSGLALFKQGRTRSSENRQPASHHPVWHTVVASFNESHQQFGHMPNKMLQNSII